jgi:hypothetical protein
MIMLIFFIFITANFCQYVEVFSIYIKIVAVESFSNEWSGRNHKGAI